MNKLTYLILHCTATPEGMLVTPDMIRQWHMDPPPKGRGWNRVGYSDMILLDGSIVNLTPYDQDDDVETWELTNGVKGMNSLCRHIVYAGGLDKNGKPKDTRSIRQLFSMKWYCFDMIQNHSKILIGGHNQFATKSCPSFDTVAWLREIGIPESNIYKQK
jgi:N-acetylmuramoyl-L-alanine amidase